MPPAKLNNHEGFREVSVEALNELAAGQFGPRGAMSVREFCEWASIGRSTLYGEVKAKRLRLHKVGRKSVVRLTDALDWLRNLPEVT